MSPHWPHRAGARRIPVQGSGSWRAYIASLSAEAEKVWQALLELGMCDADAVATARAGPLAALQGAITIGQARYRNQDCFKRTVKGEG
jgi:hypothetical protein